MEGEGEEEARGDRVGGRGEGGRERRKGVGGGEENPSFSNTLTLLFHYGESEPKVKMFKTNSQQTNKNFLKIPQRGLGIMSGVKHVILGERGQPQQ